MLGAKRRGRGHIFSVYISRGDLLVDDKDLNLTVHHFTSEEASGVTWQYGRTEFLLPRPIDTATCTRLLYIYIIYINMYIFPKQEIRWKGSLYGS